MSIFRVAISGDFRKPDGSMAFPSFTLSPLEADADVEWAFVEPVEGRMTAGSLAGFDALILLRARFDAESIPGDGRLGLVARFGVGYDTVNVAACTSVGVGVAITPDGVRRSVAVSILTFILALSGKLFIKDALTRRGPEGFAESSDHMGNGLIGRTLGSVGMGNIGAEMFRLCRPLDMRFIAHDPWADEAVAADLGVILVDLETVFAESDFLALNTSLTPDTRHLVNAARLATMKPTAYVINTSRGPVIDQPALAEALTVGVIAGAALDVFDPEPPPADDPILALGNVITTPHALSWTDQCFAEIGASDVAQVLSLKKGEAPAHLVDRSVADHPAFRSRLEAYRTAFG